MQEFAIQFSTRVGLLIAGLCTQVLLAHLLMPEGRGAYAICVLFGSLLGFAFTPGADVGTQYAIMSGRVSVSQAVSASIGICLVGTGIAAAVATPLLYTDLVFFQQAETLSFFVALSLIPLIMLATAFELQLAGLRRFAALAYLNSIRSITLVAVVITLVWGVGWGVNGAIASLAISHAAFLGLGLLELRRSHSFKAEIPKRQCLRLVMGYGLRFYLARIGTNLDPRIGALLLGISAGRAEIGLFTLASVVMMQIFTIPNAVSAVVLPRVAGHDLGRPDLVALSTRFSLLASGIAVVVFVLAPDSVITTLFSPSFLPMTDLINPMAPGILAYAYAVPILSYFRGTDRPQLCSAAMWIGLAANVIAFLILYPRFGLIGSAWAMTIGLVLRSFMLTLMFTRTSKVSFWLTCIPQRSDLELVWRSASSILRTVLRYRTTSP